MPARPTIGFIGLGLMGQAFTKRLVAAGYTVTGFDIAAEKVEQATRHGVVAATSSADVTSKSDVVLLCVVSTDAVHEAVFGSGGVVESASADKLLVDHSTTIMESTKTMADTLRERSGMGWVDAPVSGGPPAAEAGTLAIMAGGSDADIARITPLMDDLASTFTHLGGVGAGQVTKMVNQILVLNNYCVLAEALALAEA
ncbi:MAG: NAD(P)-dependent oxidoreductase, partial [Gammaproteobacteria bacterium]